ncbi:MAG: amino acid permease [Mucilaginibacter polytrichastri]|nr:amino acid permease [Mucilaginibacter polytrichastri]
MAHSLFRKKSLTKIIADAQAHPEHGEHSLRKVLRVKDLTFMGIAAVVGAGIFSTIGEASFNGGPGVTFLFIITAVTCGFSALCYAEFASRIPVSGSAYTYSYVTFGELVAWIIGWALILEYAIGNIAVAISWSGYFYNLLAGLGIRFPAWLTMDYGTAFGRYEEALTLVQGGGMARLSNSVRLGYEAYVNAPIVGGMRVILNLPAFLITVIITWVVYIGIRESKKTTNFMVMLKIGVILFVIVAGFFYIKPENWHPFLPNGFGGVLKGVSAVFFAYIGFDAVSTTAEECENPQRDLPKGMMYSLVICTILYILIALVLTGMVPFSELKVADPLAFVFERVGLSQVSYIISVSAVIATASVLLVFQMGQPRIWMSMSRDGLLPRRFAKVHPKYKTPSFATLITGLIVGLPAMFLDLSIVTDLTSIGTLFAFILVCGGVLLLPKDEEVHSKRFRLPYINSQLIIPLVFLLILVICKKQLIATLTYAGGWSAWQHNIPFLAFVITGAVITFFSITRKLSLIPVLGLLSCFYLMTEIELKNWIVFSIWLIVGLLIYFGYSYRNSLLNQKSRIPTDPAL